MTNKCVDLPIQSLNTASGDAHNMLASAKETLGFVPNMYGAMVNEPVLYEVYASGYAKFREKGGFSPIEQEVIFLVISRENGCHYCVAAHSFIADEMSGVPQDITEAIRENKMLPDGKLDALANFTETMVASRGRPTHQDVSEFLAAGFSEENILGIILAIGIKTLSNYTNHIFDTDPDDVFQGRAWRKAV